MDLKNVDVRPQSLHAPIHGIEDMLPAKTDLIDHLAIVRGHGADSRLSTTGIDAEVAFRQDDELLPWYVVLLDGFADDLFRSAIGVYVSLLKSSAKLRARGWYGAGARYPTY